MALASAHVNGEKNGALDVDKDSCCLIPLSPTTTTKKTEPIRPTLEKTMPIHATLCINSLKGKDCTQMMKMEKLKTKFPLVSYTPWLRYFTQSFVEAVEDCATFFFSP